MFRSAAVATFLAGSASLSCAQYVSVDLTNQFNDYRSTLYRGTSMAYGPQVFAHGNDLVPVNLGGGVDGNDLWSWCAAPQSNGPSGTVNLVVPVAIHGPSTVFTMMNTLWGNANPNGLLSVTFRAGDGLEQTFVLVGGVDIRDYNSTTLYTDTINGTSTQMVFENGRGQRLDMQRFDLDPAFGERTLTSISFSDYGEVGVQRMFLTGITAMVPAPGAASLLGLAGFGAFRRQR